MTSLSQALAAWLTQKPVEPSVMEPIPSRARLASDTQAERESRAEILRVLGMLPLPGADIAQVAGDLTAESELTPLGVAKAVAGVMMPVRGGKGKINVMGEASKVNPEVLKRIRDALARKVPAKVAYQAENALPMLRPETPQKVTDAWVPLMPPKPKINQRVLRNFKDMRDYPDQLNEGEYVKTTWGALYGDAPENVSIIKQHYPDLLDREVRLFATDPMGSGTSKASHAEVDAFITDPSSPRSLQAISAHEMTHDLARMSDLAPGYNQKATRGDVNRQLVRAADAVDLLREGLGRPVDADLIEGVIKNQVTVDPGLGKLPAPYDKASNEMRSLARSLAWQKRLMETDDPFYKLYKAYHGEQAAKGAQQYATGQTPAFSTPLSKHIMQQGALEATQYPLQLQKLYELKRAGFFDPLANPYEMPESFDPRFYTFTK